MISAGNRNQADYAAYNGQIINFNYSTSDRKEFIADILTWIDTHIKPDEAAIIAVDAPTLIPNATGSRLPDKLSHKHFGKYHAGCYPANLNLP